MTNDVSTSVFGGKVNVDDMRSLAAKAQESANNNPRGGGAPAGSDYMNFSGKMGRYTIGKDERVITADEVWVIDCGSIEEGWICWKGGKPASTRMANIYTGVPVQQPAPDELGPFDDARGEGWFQAKGMVLRSFDNDQQGYFKINSISGVSAMADLIGQFAERAAAGLPCWPVVCLDAEKFEAQGYKNFKPVFDVQGWLDTAQLDKLGAEDADIEALMAENLGAAAVTDQSGGTDDEPADEAPTKRRRARK